MNRIYWFLLAGLAFFHVNTLQAQISEGGLPPSFAYGTSLRSGIPVEQVPIPFNVEDMKLVDEWQVSQGAPLKIATLIPADLNPENSGTWTTLPGGETVWQLNIQAEGAIALMLYYKAFYIPEGGKLFIYNADKTQVIGAFTHQSNPVTEKFATEFIAGDDIVLEYVAAPDNEKPRIEIEDIGYGYNHLYVSHKPSLRGAASCEVNINCEEGNDWQTEKRGVCKMIQRIGTKTYLCSASLVNNTAEDFKPYILSAFHCAEFDGLEASASDYNQWLFYFHYERSGCDDNSPAVSYQTMVGCTKMAGIPMDGGSDGLLLLLNQQIPDDYYVYYNGWDRTNTPATSGVGIHHPEGDYKKISTFTSRVTSASWLDEDDNEGAERAHWNVVFVETPNGHGVTEGGSSGSPLFNQNKLIVGTLSGGNSSCEEPNGLNLYGKLYFHWDQYSSKPAERMDVWLDPLNSGAQKLAGRYKAEPVMIEKPTNLQLTYLNNQVQLTWQAPPTQRPVSYNIYKNNEFLESTTGRSYTDNPSQTGSIVYSVSAIYKDNTESSVISKTIYITEYLAPSNPTARFVPASGVVLNWDAPLYQQTIYWGTGSTAMTVGFSGAPFYFGQGWTTDDIAPFVNKTVRAIQFAPVKGATYSLLIVQGNRKYTQRLNNPVYGKLNVVELQTPFTIGNDGMLIASIYASEYGEKVYPAWCDSGPAESRKGNLVSEDGTNWQYVEGEDYDFNFFLAVVVSSEEGSASLKSAPGGNMIIGKSAKRPSLLTTKANGMSLKSRVPAPFPEVSGYNIYRNKQKVNRSPVIGTRYVDPLLGANGSYNYAVSAVYGTAESGQITVKGDVIVDTEHLTGNQPTVLPTLFDNYITITNAEEVKKLEIITLDGKLVKQVDNPGSTVYTDTLPKGIYLFRLTTNKEVKIIRGIKK